MHRAVVLLLALSWLAMSLPSGQAQAGQPGTAGQPPATVAVDDPGADVGGPAGAGAAFVDLVRAEASAQQGDLGFRATLRDLSGDLASGFGWEVWLAFEYRGTRHHAVIEGQTTADVPPEARDAMWGPLRGTLYRIDEAGPVFLRTLPAGVDAAARTFNLTLPWADVVATDGFSPQAGEAVRILEAAAAWAPALFVGPHNPTPFPVPVDGSAASDVATFPEGTFLTIPGAQGDLALATALPMRSSNGEATTMHWPVQVGNRGARDLDVAFELEAAGAEARVPPGLRLAAGSSATVNVFVTVPFNHEHGTTRSFPLRASAGPDDWAVLQLGIDYPAIAQPAGHHPDLYLHASASRVRGSAVELFSGSSWMNTLETDERATAELLMPDFDACPAPPDTPAPVVGPVPALNDFGSMWMVPLDPGLALGLDGRLGEASPLDLTLVAAAALPPGTLHGRLMPSTEAFGQPGPFANATDPFRASVPVPATPGPARLALHLDLPMPPSLDLLPPMRGQNLLLALMHCLDAPAPAGMPAATASTFAGLVQRAPVAIAAGAHLRLAVDEYHDPIAVHAASGVELVVEDPARRAAPGATVLWTPLALFPGDATGEHVVRLFGTGAAQAELLAASRVRAPDTAQLPVRFVVPDDAPRGHVYDLLLDVTHATDPARSAALRLTVTVDPDEARDDADALADAAGPSKESPAVALATLLPALAALASARRRQ